MGLGSSPRFRACHSSHHTTSLRTGHYFITCAHLRSLPVGDPERWPRAWRVCRPLRGHENARVARTDQGYPSTDDHGGALVSDGGHTPRSWRRRGLPGCYKIFTVHSLFDAGDKRRWDWRWWTPPSNHRRRRGGDMGCTYTRTAAFTSS